MNFVEEREHFTCSLNIFDMEAIFEITYIDIIIDKHIQYYKLKNLRTSPLVKSKRKSICSSSSTYSGTNSACFIGILHSSTSCSKNFSGIKEDSDSEWCYSSWKREILNHLTIKKTHSLFIDVAKCIFDRNLWFGPKCLYLLSCLTVLCPSLTNCCHTYFFCLIFLIHFIYSFVFKKGFFSYFLNAWMFKCSSRSGSKCNLFFFLL